MNGFKGELLAGNCLNQVDAGSAFPSVSLHVLFYTREITQPVDFQTGLCGNKMILPHDAAGKNAIPYGSDTGLPIGVTFRQKIRFDLADVAKWLPVVTAPYGIPAYTVTYTGPRFTMPNTYIRLTKRDQANDPYLAAGNVYWQDATDTTWGEDWLGNLMPGGWCYSNRHVAEPMMADSFFEDSLSDVNRSGTGIHEDFTLFCEALPVYNEAGGLEGTFDGLAWIAFWNLGAVKNPVKPPDDMVYIGPPPVPKLDPKRQILVLEVWIYLAKNSSGKFLKSPRVAALRYWTYTRIIGGITTPWDPYLFFGAGASVGGSVAVPIKFPLLQNANNPEQLTEQVAYLSLSNLKFFIGA